LNSGPAAARRTPSQKPRLPRCQTSGFGRNPGRCSEGPVLAQSGLPAGVPDALRADV